MKLACATLCFRNRRRDEIMETLEYAPKVGFRFLEIAGPITWDAGSIQWVDRAKFKNELKKANMVLTGSFFPPIPTESEKEALKGAEYVNMISDFVVEMGGELIVSSGGPRQGGKRGLKNTVKGLEKVIEYIDKNNYNLRVALESLDPTAELCGSSSGKQICVPSDYEFIFDNIQSEKIGITADIGHLYTTGVDIVDFINTYSDKIFNVHLKDHIGRQSVPIGKGEIDFNPIVQALRDINYGGYLALELELEDPKNAPEHVKESWGYVSKLVS